MSELLTLLLDPDPPPFAVLHRPAATGPATLEVLTGEMAGAARLADLRLPDTIPGQHGALLLVPFRQVAERGYDCVDDGAPLLAMTITGAEQVPLHQALDILPDDELQLHDGRFDLDDQAYGEIVAKVVEQEIGRGAGANFVLRRSYLAHVDGYSPRSALTLLRRLLLGETGAHWTFAVYTGHHTLVGASPERHVSLEAGTAVMNPVSGTYRYPATGPSLDGIRGFLADAKETDELFMVVDEELKMMSQLCPDGPRVAGPHLKEMTRLAHTEYLVEGTTTEDPRRILQQTMFAPTVTGSPLENACRVVSRYEAGGRGYYSGVAALIGRDEQGAPRMDSSILIRTAEIDPHGHVTIGVGATVVRHSEPSAEAAETASKADALLTALGARTRHYGTHPEVLETLHRRNERVAAFWMAGPDEPEPEPDLSGRRLLVVDAEDTFTTMIAHQMRASGLHVDTARYDEHPDLLAHDLIVLGPGPGDPRRTDDPRIAYLHGAAAALLTRRQPFLAVCLSHQVVCEQLGLPVARRAVPSQGEQREIDLFGGRERVGFYNAFAAHADTDEIDAGELGRIQVSRDAGTGEVHALRGNRFATLQFHAESVLTRNGRRILTDRLREVLAA